MQKVILRNWNGLDRMTIATKLCILIKQDKIKIFTGSTTLAKILRDTPSVCGKNPLVFIGLAMLTKTTSQDQDTKRSLKWASNPNRNPDSSLA